MGVWLSEPVFGHGQLNVAASRVGSRDRIMFAIKPDEEGFNNFTSNVVYKEVLLDAPEIPMEVDQQDFSDAVEVDLDPFTTADTDYDGPHDELWAESELEDRFVFKEPAPVRKKKPTKIRSASPPKNLASPDKTVPRKRPLSSAAHDAWIASLPEPFTEELTKEEKEREAMLQRRADYFKRIFSTM